MVAEQGRERLQRHVAERIQDFDIPALLSLLSRMGYGSDQIEFRSHRTTVHQPHLLQEIQFIPADFDTRLGKELPARVEVTVNLGLLGIQTPLPSFFFREMDQIDPEKMERFIGYFDHVLLSARFRGLFPERDESLLPGWTGKDSTLHRLQLLRLASPSSLHWLCSKVFPEAEVAVQRETSRQRIDARGLRLGSGALGDGAAVGGFASVPMGGVIVWIYLDGSSTGDGKPWAEEARLRLHERILPYLVDALAPVTVILVLRDQQGFAQLEDTSYLGYDPIRGGPEHARQIILFSGIPSKARSTRER
ncbi:hypothetical protein [Hyalangium rubrum]|uniref:Type VI secretion system baseplate subunit TssG n=1 Tax=Hyalangium rubrum TaxID=3103134 RepID=A0ABU5HI84_9BACT|nr:hypothetical protein [Hyalangium sp. s54d21]MDY7233066.1 hypothetical protein [Hyalangium sp. s54d21]